METTKYRSLYKTALYGHFQTWIIIHLHATLTLTHWHTSRTHSNYPISASLDSQRRYRVQVATCVIIAIKSALWQFSKKCYCVLVHRPRLKSKKLTKCDSRKLKFHTKPHNNHTQNEKLHVEELFPSWSSFLFMHDMHVANCWCSTSLVLKAAFQVLWLLWGFVWNFNFR